MHGSSSVGLIAAWMFNVLIGSTTVLGQIPDPVSPGALDRVAEIDGRCPTFTWAPVVGAVEHEIVGYRLPDEIDNLWTLDLSDAEIAVHATVPGAASAWQPGLADCLTPGARYVWFVRGIFGDREDETSEWSHGRFFSLSDVPAAREVEEALSVLRRYLDANEAGRAGRRGLDPSTDGSRGTGNATARQTAIASAATKSATSAKTAIKGTVSDTSGETYGVVGIGNSPDGAGLAAANTNGGPDLVLDGSADAEPDAILSQAGIDRPSPTSQWFSLINSDAGMLNLDVEGKIVGSALVVSDAADLTDASITLTGASITGGTYSSGTFGGVHTGDGSGLTDIDAGSITTGRLAGAQLPEYTPWDCRWYVDASDSETVSVDCADDRHLVSGFCYTTDTSCGVGWYRPVGLHDLTAGIHLPDVGTGMYCVFTGTCDDVGSPNKAIALCCSTD